MFSFGAIALLGLVFLAYIRLAPTPVTKWHRSPDVLKDTVLANGIQKRIPIGKAGLRRIDRIAEADPRTERLAGSVEQGLVTYVTRSRLIGFPDYTTVMQAGEDLVIYARSRFGRRDFGANSERVSRWLNALAAY